MSEQSEFIKRIGELIELAGEQENVIFEEQLEAIFPEAKADSAKKQVLLDYLKEKRIGLNEKLDGEEFINEEEKKYLDFYIEDLKGAGELSSGEREVFRKRAIAGDMEAANVVLQDYLINVVDIAKLYAGQGVMIEDLIGEANIALVMSLEGLGALEEHVEVDGYFGKICMDTMQDLIAARLDELSEDEKMIKKVNAISKAASDLAALLGRPVTVDELVLESGFTKAAIEKALRLTNNKIADIEISEGDK